MQRPHLAHVFVVTDEQWDQCAQKASAGNLGVLRTEVLAWRVRIKNTILPIQKNTEISSILFLLNPLCPSNLLKSYIAQGGNC